ncbi:hypothetical protein GCM10018780_06140 [Streptomyces lanatus]|nr:hypothetical protein GCM10018780_06140 [Streptomyces lanatus]
MRRVVASGQPPSRSQVPILVTHIHARTRVAHSADPVARESQAAHNAVDQAHVAERQHPAAEMCLQEGARGAGGDEFGGELGEPGVDSAAAAWSVPSARSPPCGRRR